MVNYIFIGLYAVAAVVLYCFYRRLRRRQDILSKSEAILENKNADLVKQLDILEAERRTHEENVRSFREVAIDSYNEMSASYAVSDSDVMKYKTDKAIANIAKNRIAHIIANDIIRKFEPTRETRDGHDIYTYNLKVKE
jgi:hypothetical protein